MHRLRSFVVETFPVSCVFLDVKLRADAKAVLEEPQDVGILSVLNMKSPQLDPGDGIDDQGQPDPSLAADDPWPTFFGADATMKYRD